MVVVWEGALFFVCAALCVFLSVCSYEIFCSFFISGAAGGFEDLFDDVSRAIL